MKCLITGKELKEDYQTLGWEGRDMLKIEMTPEMAIYFLANIDKCHKNKRPKVSSLLYNVIENSQLGETTMILAPVWFEIINSFKNE